MISLPSSAFYTDNPTTRYLYIAKRRVYGPICSISFIGQLKRPKFSERLVWLYYYLKEILQSKNITPEIGPSFENSSSKESNVNMFTEKKKQCVLI
ncbi:hypothetical protein GGP41_002637 [Bipolaris sorokiniana]|uniref:Uncharacterized protein n=1 Tax=Cochliobolus sativus TaxID=45130 RepID=A0A8H5ZJF0_COCSA|nr:hypothetical protein GGP41_002637 [Bipolaris sorokiniana]